MAQSVTLDGLRAQIIRSIEGRKLGFTLGNSSDNSPTGYLTGVKDLRVPIQALTTASTAADQINPYGVVTFGTSTTGGTTFHSVLSPVPGAHVTLFNASTGYQAVWLNNSTGTTGVTGIALGSEGVFMTTATSIKLTGKGSWAQLIGVSTSQWGVLAQTNTTVTTWGTSIT